MENRQKVRDLLKLKANLEEDWATDFEIGIYNWCIKYADTHRVIKNWDNQKFVNLYREKARSCISNIDKDSYIKNERLIERLLEKEFLPHEIPFMKPENVFPERWNDTLDVYTKKYENAYERNTKAMTDLYRCGRCKSRSCVYSERMTRSADEPMLIVIKCLNCGNGWRM